ncbi:alpha/beta hydrolase [Leptobacterium sp. I13]|uniref:alpha/beta hydrolase n=1 Tax=Leptobacterium meishanense TaxID=3128904 RepID=UPI0030ECE136
MRTNTHLLVIVLIGIVSNLRAQQTITFPSKDNLTITADLYSQANSEKFIILFHQARWSRGEYLEIAPKLTKMGYNCLAVDLRSGGTVNSISNETYKEATTKGKTTGYVDAYQDIETSVAYIKEKHNPKKIIIWGSSYSSALVLKYGGDYPEMVDAILSFAPGEYFGEQDFIKRSAQNITVPVFITSAKKEQGNWQSIYDVIPSTSKAFYLPETKGNHGSRALWEQFNDHKGYWQAVERFLITI